MQQQQRGARAIAPPALHRQPAPADLHPAEAAVDVGTVLQAVVLPVGLYLRAVLGRGGGQRRQLLAQALGIEGFAHKDSAAPFAKVRWSALIGHCL
ncbi:hypothetical protein D3C81_1942210 [compost metagenome]